MPVVPNTLERLAFLRLNRGPGPLIDLVAAGSFQAAAAAVDLGVFAALADGGRSSDALAAAVDADPATLESLLALLAAAGYVERRGDRYENTAMTRRWLTDAEGTDMGPWLVAWRDVVFPFWTERIDAVLREGAPGTDVYEWAAADPDRAATLHAGFRAAARLGVDDALEAVPTAGATRLLDVGGGHGLFAVAFAEATPGLSAVVFDRPAAEATFRETVAGAAVGDRVTFEAGDYLVDDLGEGFDLALLFNVVHAHDEATDRALLGRVFDALAPGGRVAIMEEFTGTGPTPIARTAIRFVDLTYRVTLGARTYSAGTITEWLEAAGFEDVTTRQTSTGVGFALGRKPETASS